MWELQLSMHGGTSADLLARTVDFLCMAGYVFSLQKMNAPRIIIME
jgi:hypothetical protein